jgi:hypothetical protein
MHVLVVAEAELPLATSIRPVPSAAVNTSLSPHFVAFLGSLFMLPPPVPSASLLSLGFYKSGCLRRTQTSMEWEIPCLVFVICVLYSWGPLSARRSICPDGTSPFEPRWLSWQVFLGVRQLVSSFGLFFLFSRLRQPHARVSNFLTFGANVLFLDRCLFLIGRPLAYPT